MNRALLTCISVLLLFSCAVWAGSWRLGNEYFFSEDDLNALNQFRPYNTSQLFTVIAEAPLSQAGAGLLVKAIHQTFGFQYQKIHSAVFLLHLLASACFGLLFYTVGRRAALLNQKSPSLLLAISCVAFFLLTPIFVSEMVTLGWVPSLLGSAVTLLLAALFVGGFQERYTVFDTILLVIGTVTATRILDLNCLLLPFLLGTLHRFLLRSESISSRQHLRRLWIVCVICFLQVLFICISGHFVFGGQDKILYAVLPWLLVLLAIGLPTPSRKAEAALSAVVLGSLFLCFVLGPQRPDVIRQRALLLRERSEDRKVFDASYALRRPTPGDRIAIVNVPRQRKKRTIFAAPNGGVLALLFGVVPAETREYRGKRSLVAISQPYVIDYNGGHPIQLR